MIKWSNNRMTYFDINEKENILDQLVITKIDVLINLLTLIGKYDRISQSDLRKQSKFSGGKIYPAVKALKATKLVDNGNGVKINDLGKKLLSSYHSDKQLFKEVLKNSFLNAPLFYKIYEKNKNVTDHKILLQLFKKELEGKYKDLDDRFIGSAVRRYLAGIYDIRLKSGAGINIIDKSEKIKIKKSFENKNSEDIIGSIKNFKKSFNLSGANLMTMIDTLPKEKRDEIVSKVFSEVI